MLVRCVSEVREVDQIYISATVVNLQRFPKKIGKHYLSSATILVAKSAFFNILEALSPFWNTKARQRGQNFKMAASLCVFDLAASFSGYKLEFSHIEKELLENLLS